MKTQKLIKAILIAAMALTFAASVSAQGGPHAGGGQGGKGKGMDREGGPMGIPFKGIHLTEAQKTQVASVLMKYREEQKTLVDKMIAARENVFEAVHASEFNEAAVRQASRELASAGEEFAVLKARISSEIRPILTAEQIQQIEDQKAEKKERMKTRKEEMRSRFDEWLEDHSE
jgi:Spy/CpxP family protein refolding chaperone